MPVGRWVGTRIGWHIRLELGEVRFCFIDRREWSQEAVPTAGQGFDEAGIVGGVAEGFAQFIDGGTKAVIEVDDRVGAPETLLDLFAGNHFAGFFQEESEYAKGLSLNPDPGSGFTQLTGGKIRLE